MVKKNNVKIIFLLCLILLFVIISLNLKSAFIPQINDVVNSWVTKIQINFFIALSKAISYLFDTLPVVIFSIIISIFLFFKRKIKGSIIFILTVGLSSLTVYLFKNLCAISRPINALILENAFSFPSGHSSIAVVLFGLLAYALYKKFPDKKLLVSLISIFCIIIISFSRLYLNVHWLSDILGGLVIGSIWLLIALFFLEK